MTSCPFLKQISRVIDLIRDILYNIRRNSRIEMPDLTPEEWVLAFVYAGNPLDPHNSEIKGKLLFTKEFFVFVKEIMPQLDSFFDFIPYDYGPFSFPLVSLLDSLTRDKVICVSTVQLQSGVRYDYKLTPEGIEIAKGIYESITDLNLKQRLEKLRSDATKMGYFPVLSYVYSKYPEYTTASKIRDVVNHDH